MKGRSMWTERRGGSQVMTLLVSTPATISQLVSSRIRLVYDTGGKTSETREAIKNNTKRWSWDSWRDNRY